MERKDLGVSHAFSTVLLLLMAVMVVSVVSIYAMGSLDATFTPITKIRCYQEWLKLKDGAAPPYDVGQRIVLEHAGGEPLPDYLIVQVRFAENDTVYFQTTISEGLNNSEDNFWSIGEQVIFLKENEGDVLKIHIHTAFQVIIIDTLNEAVWEGYIEGLPEPCIPL